jgi:DNA mismatch endonuclease (patch repair protein)
MDHLNASERSENMRRIRGKNTQPEMAVRKLVFSMGYRYRLHYAALPGRPDLAFVGKRKVIFVHGCFWHRHASCKFARMPKTNPEFWAKKLRKNKARDVLRHSQLRRLGWKTLVLWECELRSINRCTNRIQKFLGG